ncbi:MAG: pirin family protein [Planctomycetota bacterium]|jgi:redox-sensitive bicupin YhaK (pirin superfamily)
MIRLRRNSERLRTQHGKHESWLTFDPREPRDASAGDFGILTAINEMRFSPDGASATLPSEEAEILTYVYKGALAQEDSSGRSGVLYAGEFQYMTAVTGTRRRESNASRTDWAHVFRIFLLPAEVGLDHAQEQERFAAALRRNALCIVASPDGRKESLRIRQDVLIYSSVLAPGRHLIHELLPGRSAWLHVISGEVSLQDIILTQGDGAGVTTESSASFMARENTEILLVDMRERSLKSPGDGSIP